MLCSAPTYTREVFVFLFHSFVFRLANRFQYFDGYQRIVTENYSNRTTNMSPPPLPYIIITEQPATTFRYRYDSEQGSHGKLMGNSNSKTNKCFPKIQILNCHGKVKLRASLYVLHGNDPIRHVHRLHGKHCNKDGVFEIEKVITMNDSEIELNDISIGHVAKKNIPDILSKRCIENLQESKSSLAKEGFWDSSDELSPVDMTNALQKAKELEGILNKKLNEVLICFEALLYVDKMGDFVPLCDSVFSHTVLNKKSTSTGELKISRLSICSGSVRGGDEVFILCEKVDRKNIKVRFFEIRDGEETWEAEGSFSEVDVHHQYAIVVKTPPYKDIGIEENVTVHLQLLRPTDESTSESRDFTYIPDREYDLRGKKRKLNYPARGGEYRNPGAFVVSSNATSTLPVLKLEMPSSSNDSSGASCSMAASEVPTTAEILEEYYTEPLAAFSVTNEPKISQNSSPVDQNQQAYYQPTLNELNAQDNQDSQFGSHYQLGTGIAVSTEQPQPMFIPEDMEFDFSSIEFDGILRSRNGMDDIDSDGPGKLETDSKNLSVDKSAVKLYGLAINTAKALHNYSRTGDTRCLLTPMRSLITYTDENGDNSAHIAVIHSKAQALEYMLSVLMDTNNSDMNVVNDCNNLLQTPLHIAVHNDDEEIVKLLMKFGANPNVQDRHGNTAFHIAGAHEKESILNALLRDPSRKLEIINHEGYTALHLAVMADSLMCAKALSESKAKIDVRAGTDGETALHMAVKNMNIEIAKYLIEQGADVDVQMFNGCTALHLAVLNESEEIVRSLVRAHADPYLENNERFLNESSSDDEKPSNEPESFSECSLENRYCNSFDLAKDNEKIHQLLHGIGLDYDIDYPSKPILLEKSLPNIDSGIGSGSSSEIDPIALDIETKRSLAFLLDPPSEKDWKTLSQCLDLDDVINKIEQENVESPTCALLAYVPTMDKLHYGLEAMDCKEALILLENYRAKNKNTDVYKTKGSSITDIVLPMSTLNLRS